MGADGALRELDDDEVEFDFEEYMLPKVKIVPLVDVDDFFYGE